MADNGRQASMTMERLVTGGSILVIREHAEVGHNALRGVELLD